MKKTTIYIRDLTKSGEGVGLINDKVIFIEKALPEEEVICEITQEKSNYSKGNLLHIIKPSSHRVDPPCPYFVECGGCQLQHADQELSALIKKNQVLSALKKIAGIDNPNVEDVFRSEDSYGYRNKITFPLLEVKGKKIIGFFKKKSHEIVSIDSCLLHIPFADKVYMNLKEKLLKSNLSFYNEKKNIGDLQHLVIRTSSYEQKVLVGIIGLKKVSKELMELSKQIAADPLVKGVVYGRKSKASNSIYPDYEELLSGEATLVEEILGVKVNISLLSFFQVNKKCAEKMYSAAFDMAALSKGAKVLDAYSGIGSFAIYLAKQGLFVTGIESFPKAVEDARINALNNGVIIDFIEGEVEKKVKSLANFDAVFINPPRKGVHKDVIDEISRLNPKKIIYTSCDPATLARDIKLFSEQGYSFIKAIPFDLFPQTMHVETVGLMEKSDGL